MSAASIEILPFGNFEISLSDPHAASALLAYAGSVRSTDATLADVLVEIVASKLRGSGQSYGALFDFDDKDLWGKFITDGDLRAHLEFLEEEVFEKSLEPFPVLDGSGGVIAWVKREFDPGDPGVRYTSNGDGYPGEPGHDYYRFMTVEEVEEMKRADGETE